MKTTNLDAVKNYISESGIWGFISPDWLDMNGIYSIIREGLDEYETFDELFGDVLVDGLTGDTAKEFLKEIGKELSEEDYRKVESIVTMFDEMAMRLPE